MGFTTRPATEEDYEFLYSLHRAAMREYIEVTWGWNEEWQEEYFRKKFDPRNRKIICVDGRNVGVVVVERHASELYLGLIELLPDYQGQGIGTTLINQLKEEAQMSQIPLGLHVLKTNLPARRLYERLGFRLVAEEEHRFRMVWYPHHDNPEQSISDQEN